MRFAEFTRSLRLEQLEDRSLLAALISGTEIDFDPKDATAAKIGYDLSLLREQYEAQPLGEGLTMLPGGGVALNAGTAAVATGVSATVIDGRVAVEAIAMSDAALLADELNALGFEVTATFGRMVGVMVPLGEIDVLSTASQLKFARTSGYEASAGSVQSQGDVAMRSDIARTTLGFDGTGVTIGVLSDSFDTSGNGSYAADIASGDLPAGINVVQDFGPPSTDEGRGMLQLIHDVAPGAGLAFATAFNTEAQFATNILALQSAGADIIVDDVIYFTEPMFQDGIVAQAVNTVTAAGIPYFSSAGNQDRVSYQSGYRNSGIDLGPGGFNLTPFTFLAHDFDPGGAVDVGQLITIPALSGTTVSFQWSDPFFSAGGAGAATDMDIALFDTVGNFLFGSFGANLGGDAVELLTINNANNFPVQAQIAIGKFSGPDPALLKYVGFGAGPIVNDFPTNSSTSFGHGNAAAAIAVGAARYDQTPPFGVSPPVLEPFSSAGGTPILFDAAGAPITPIIRSTPDIVAPDGSNTSFFGALGPGDIENDGLPNFFGTSAAAPHAAALAALLMQANPSLTPTQVQTALTSTAIDMGAAGFDFDSGFGLVNATAAFTAIGQDFGDAPISYGTLLAGGARHAVSSTLRLGSEIDLEFDGQPSATAQGDDAAGVDDEDGVTLPGAFIARVGAAITVNASAAGRLDAWIDYNRNGVFDASEKIANNLAVTAGNNTLNLTVPANIVAGASYARFRLSSSGGLGPTGLAADGEVEDYAVNLLVPAPGTIQLVPDPANPGDNLLLVNGRSISDAIVVRPAILNPALLEVVMSPFVVQTSFPLAAVDRIAVFGLEGSDSIVIDSRLFISATVFGDGGNDSIVGGSADDYLDGGDGIDSIAGGFGDDVILGGLGDDYLYGEAGFDVIIGGLGRDSIQGGTEEDLIIGGRLVQDTNEVALRAIGTTWSNGLPFATRIALLAGQVNAATVLDDGLADFIFGNTGRDWLLDFALRDFFFDFDPNPITGDRRN